MVKRYFKPKVECSICHQILSKNGFTGHMKFKHKDQYEVFMKDKSAFMLPVEDKTPTEPATVPVVEPVVKPIVETVVEPVVEPAPVAEPTPEVNESATAGAFPEPTPEQNKRFRLFRRRTD